MQTWNPFQPPGTAGVLLVLGDRRVPAVYQQPRVEDAVDKYYLPGPVGSSAEDPIDLEMLPAPRRDTSANNVGWTSLVCCITSLGTDQSDEGHFSSPSKIALSVSKPKLKQTNCDLDTTSASEHIHDRHNVAQHIDVIQLIKLALPIGHGKRQEDTPSPSSLPLMV